MKSVKITDCDGPVLVKVTAKNGGIYDVVTLASIADKIKIEIREDGGSKVTMLSERKPVKL